MIQAGYYLEAVREKRPLVHSITNYVTVTDVANMILACGARPVMADLPQEAEEVTAACDALNINMGTMKDNSLDAMLLAGKEANRGNKPVVLDPVGVGMTMHRKEAVHMLLENIRLDVIRGNLSEILELGQIAWGSNVPEIQPGLRGSLESFHGGIGIDAGTEGAVSDANLVSYSLYFRKLAEKLGCVIVTTGALDLVTVPDRSWVIRNGRSEMSRVIGTGCMLDGLLASFLAAGEDALQAAAAAVCCMDIAGEIGWDRLQPGEGNASYRDRMIDAVSCMSGEELDRYIEKSGKVCCIQ